VDGQKETDGEKKEKKMPMFGDEKYNCCNGDCRKNNIFVIFTAYIHT
jgi:hypothetical protein